MQPRSVDYGSDPLRKKIHTPDGRSDEGDVDPTLDIFALLASMKSDFGGSPVSKQHILV